MVVTYDLTAPLARNPVIAVTVFGTLATVTTGLRFYALQLRRVKPGAPEYLIIAALCIVYVDIAIQYILSILGGAGRHDGAVEPESVVLTLKTILPLEALYGIVMGLVKSSIMLFYTRIFGAKRSFQISVAVVMTIVWLWAISVILETFLLCRPLAYNWDTSLPGGVCGNRNATFVIAGTLNLITDLMVMALPVPHIWKLHLTLAKKVVLSLVFCMGLLVSIISIIRLTSLMAIDFTDITYSVQMGVMWTVLEPELAIVCANMPLLRPILSRIFPRLLPSSNDRKYAVSDPQTFERLDEQAAIYPMNRIDHEHMKTNISAGAAHDDKPHGDYNHAFVSSTTRSIDGESRDSDQQHLPSHATSPGGINVTQNFNVRYN